MYSTLLVQICLSFGWTKVTLVIAYFDVKNIAFAVAKICMECANNGQRYFAAQLGVQGRPGG